MTAPWRDGDDPLPPGQAKKQTADMLADPRHQKQLGSPEDNATIDDPIEEDEE